MRQDSVVVAGIIRPVRTQQSDHFERERQLERRCLGTGDSCYSVGSSKSDISKQKAQ